MITLFIWLALITVAICVTVNITLLKTAKIVLGISVVAFTILTTGMVSAICKNDAFKDKGEMFVATMENYNAVSSNENFLIFVVDTIDSRTFQTIVDSNHEYMAFFKDFSYFKDTMSVSPFTI